MFEKDEGIIVFSKKIWTEDEIFFEADLLLGLDFFIKKDYVNAKKHFERLNEISRYYPFFDDIMVDNRVERV